MFAFVILTRGSFLASEDSTTEWNFTFKLINFYTIILRLSFLLLLECGFSSLKIFKWFLRGVKQTGRLWLLTTSLQMKIYTKKYAEAFFSSWTGWFSLFWWIHQKYRSRNWMDGWKYCLSNQSWETSLLEWYVIIHYYV